MVTADRYKIAVCVCPVCHKILRRPMRLSVATKKNKKLECPYCHGISYGSTLPFKMKRYNWAKVIGFYRECFVFLCYLPLR